VVKELRRIIAKVKKSALEQRIDIPICEIHGHIRDLLDYLNLTPNEYNKFLTHLSIVISDLVEKEWFSQSNKGYQEEKTVKDSYETGS
jgi:hypothetical protein